VEIEGDMFVETEGAFVVDRWPAPPQAVHECLWRDLMLFRRTGPTRRANIPLWGLGGLLSPKSRLGDWLMGCAMCWVGRGGWE
jgi:hypothetical protein